MIVLGDTLSGSAVYYGRADLRTDTSDPATKVTYLSVEYGEGLASPSCATGYSVRDGAYVAATLNSKGDGYSNIRELTQFPDVPNSAWSGESAVTVGGRTYTVPSNVPCYNKASGMWTTLSAAHAFSQLSTLYADGNGVIRVIEVR